MTKFLFTYLYLMMFFLCSLKVFALQADLKSEDIELPLLHEQMHEQKKFKYDKKEYDYVVIDFWASWCEPCKASFPFFEEQNQLWKKHRVLFLGVSVDSDRTSALEFLKKNSVQYPVLFDEDHKLLSRMDVTAVPRTFIFDNQMHLVESFKGYTSIKREDMRFKFKQIFSQGGKK